MNPEDSTPGHHGQTYDSMNVYSQHQDDHGDIQTATNQPFLAYSNQLPVPFGLQLFYENNSGPWTPVAASASEHHNGFTGSLTGNFQPAGAMLYRSKALASECDTSLPGDSGYASRPVPSVGQPSRVANDFPDSERLGDLHIDTQSQVAQLGLGLTAPQATSHTGTTIGNIPCPRDGCGATIKTKSELTKHLHRHDKPYLCELPNCPRSQGFSTRNDLQRHQRTVHQKTGGDAQTYYCVIGECAKKPSMKPWPRADNFRQHLQRVHGLDKKAEEDLTPFLGVPTQQPRIEISEEQSNFSDANGLTLTGIGTFDNLNGLDHPQELPDSHMIDGSRDEPPHGTQTSTIATGKWQATPQGTLNDSGGVSNVDEELVPDPEEQRAQTCWPGQKSGSQENLRKSPSIPQTTSDSGERPTSAAGETAVPRSPSSICLEVSTPAARPDIQQIVDALPNLLASRRQAPADASSIAESLRKLIPSETLATVVQILTGHDTAGTKHDTSESKHPFPCGECPKSFSRQCELKKHKRRHEKPYECTFKGCRRTFGSKNDWKRHESSQHLQLETWSCNYNGCSKICNRRESFKNHLMREHDQKADANLEQQLEKRRLGRHCDRQYWCGFCKSIQNITENNVNCWTVRCDHIDDHICGRNDFSKMLMASWVYLEDQSRPGSPSQDGVEPSTNPPPAQMCDGPEQNNRSLKRKNEGPDIFRPRKQVQTQSQEGWLCCHCTDALLSTHTNASCTGCEHYRCSNCQLYSFDVTNRGDKQVQETSG